MCCSHIDIVAVVSRYKDRFSTVLVQDPGFGLCFLIESLVCMPYCKSARFNRFLKFTCDYLGG